MIKLYTRKGSSSSRKARQWLQDHQLGFEECKVDWASLSEEEVKQMLIQSENGFGEVLSQTSSLYKEESEAFDLLTFNQLVAFISKHPLVLHLPIMMDERKILVGFNEEVIRKFIPRVVRREEIKQVIF